MAPRTPAGPVLSPRALNRALLDRQMLLARSDRTVPEAIGHLVGLQAQAPRSPYVALWSRLAGFDPHELGAMLTDRRAVRIVIMRSTIHLVTADDCRFLRPLHDAMLMQRLRTSTWMDGLRGADLDAVVAAGRALVEARPLAFKELGAGLAASWPDHDPDALAQAVRAGAPLVQVPPRAVWGRAGTARHTTAEAWLGRPLTGGGLDDLVLRYLAAFGPASVMDVQAWSGLTRLKEVTDGLGDRVVRFRTEAGRELLDLPDAPRPDGDTPAPLRFLPDYDNVVLSHADRTRVVDDPHRRRIQTRNGAIPGTVLVDGRVAGMWALAQDSPAAVLAVTLFHEVAAADRTAIGEEGVALARFLAGDAADHDVRIAVDPG
ncbi:MAG TPA: winged helix DNA-binding domain-containing protein [Acidimicrobiales bacterium]|nr:winged helix DNA-binding domain-containing protein [Acidimicrobiales bacterium]